MKIKFKQKKLFRKLIYYANRFFSEKLIENNEPLAGYSFDAIHHSVNIFGAYESQEIEVIRNFLLKNLTTYNIALDVGAHIGNHTVRLLSPLFDEVICFEPNPYIYPLLSVNTSKHANVKTFNFGLSDEIKELDFKINMTNWGASRIIQKNVTYESKKFSTIKINVRALDQLNLGINKEISLIKVDIEGHELEFLRGAKDTILKHRPIILFEENSINQGSSGVIDYLAEMDYEFFIIKENFFFGDGKVQRLLQYLFQDLFGTTFEIVKASKFKNRYYHLVIATSKV